MRQDVEPNAQKGRSLLIETAAAAARLRDAQKCPNTAASHRRFSCCCCFLLVRCALLLLLPLLALTCWRRSGPPQRSYSS